MKKLEENARKFFSCREKRPIPLSAQLILPGFDKVDGPHLLKTNHQQSTFSTSNQHKPIGARSL